MSIENVAWGDALGITGARAVIVTAIDTRKPLRLAAVDALPDGESVAEMAAAMAETAVELVRLTDPDTAMDDLLVSSRGWFHVLRVVEDAGATGYVAHLLLDRREANLAMARREFRDLLDGVALPELVPEPTGPGQAGPGQAGPEPTRPEPTGPEPKRPDARGPAAAGSNSTGPEARVPETAAPRAVAPRPAGPLPRRTPSTTGPWERGASHGDTPSWFDTFAGQPFESDGRTVERVRDGLYELG